VRDYFAYGAYGSTTARAAVRRARLLYLIYVTTLVHCASRQKWAGADIAAPSGSAEIDVMFMTGCQRVCRNPAN
jgi:hypothetical protein